MVSPTGTALRDQLDAAQRDVQSVFQTIAAAPGRKVAHVRASDWLVAVVSTVATSPVRRSRCKHAAKAAGPMPLALTVHARVLECLPCASARARRMRGTLEDRRCDCCRTLIPEGEVLPFCVQVGPVLVSGGHCEACTATVRGIEAPRE